MKRTGMFIHLVSTPWIRWVGARYLQSKKSSGFLSMITVFSVAGIALGVMALLVVLSVMDGFEAQLKKRLMSFELHVLATPTAQVEGFQAGFVPQSAFDPRLLAEDSRIAALWPIVSTEAIMRFGRKVTGVQVKGIDPERMKVLKGQLVETAEEALLVKGDGPDRIRVPGIYIGKELAYSKGLIPGDYVTLISPTEMEGPLSTVPRMRRFVIEGIYHSGTADQELSTVFAMDSSVRAFLGRRDVVSQWEMAVRDFDQAPAVAEDLRKRLPGFQVKDWVELNSTLFGALLLERVAMFVILALIVVVASFNIITTLTLMVQEKKREISILKAMGARGVHVASIFLYEGILIGGVGTGLGVGGAAAICYLLSRYEFIQLPGFYQDRTLPVTFEPMYYLLTALAAFVIVLLASQVPSRRAARVHPLQGIRG